MTPLNFAIVGLKLLGIYIIFESGTLFTAFALMSVFAAQISTSTGQPATPGFLSSLISLIPGGLQVLFGVLLFVLSEPLARRMIPPVRSRAKKVVCSFEEVQSIAFAAVGILIVVDTFPILGRTIQSLYDLYHYAQQSGDIAPDRLRESWLYSVGVLAKLIIGLVLFLNPQGFRNIWHWLRTAGTKQGT